MARKDLFISDLLEDLGNIKTAKNKKDFLLSWECRELKTYFKGAFDKSIEFNIPEITRTYTSKPNSEEGWGAVSREFRYFSKGGDGDNLTESQILDKFISVLERVSPEEAKAILLMTDKKLVGKYKGVTKKLISDSFPGLIVK
jgi:hypothetical protein|tara:strand:- start:15 stop:443 length:429 start_codon:yes stop_codon:yes gene_type:complete